MWRSIPCGPLRVIHGTFETKVEESSLRSVTGPQCTHTRTHIHTYVLVKSCFHCSFPTLPQRDGTCVVEVWILYFPYSMFFCLLLNPNLFGLPSFCETKVVVHILSSPVPTKRRRLRGHPSGPDVKDLPLTYTSVEN